MRLLNTETYKLEEYIGDKVPSYAILSHRWGEGEVSYSDYRKERNLDGPGYSKIIRACDFARGQGNDFIWIDTCCIDKRSSAELSETINSMFTWYSKADVCYAYLSDVCSSDESPDKNALKSSEWLHELIAPQIVVFLSSTWDVIGAKEKRNEEEPVTRPRPDGQKLPTYAQVIHRNTPNLGPKSSRVEYLERECRAAQEREIYWEIDEELSTQAWARDLGRPAAESLSPPEGTTGTEADFVDPAEVHGRSEMGRYCDPRFLTTWIEDSGYSTPKDPLSLLLEEIAGIPEAFIADSTEVHGRSVAAGFSSAPPSVTNCVGNLRYSTSAAPLFSLEDVSEIPEAVLADSTEVHGRSVAAGIPSASERVTNCVGTLGYSTSAEPLFALLEEITGIPEAVLADPTKLHGRSVAERMSWASKRVTISTEDSSYCLLGLLDVNMPLLYGEGDKAFIRLQREILSQSLDESLFAWSIDVAWSGFPFSQRKFAIRNSGRLTLPMFATSTKQFAMAAHMGISDQGSC